MKRKLLRDPDVVSCINNPPQGEPEEYVRAFSWFPNESLPHLLQPLLKLYLNWSESLLRDKRDVIFITHIIWYFLFLIIVDS